MRLLSSALLFLLAASSSLGAPTAAPSEEEQRTTIETIYETVTYTKIHNVTDAPEMHEDVEGSGVDAEPTSVPDSIKATRDRLDALERKIRKAEILLDSLTATTEETSVAETVVHYTRMCSCAEATECREVSEDYMEPCIEECYDQMEGNGDKKDAYVECFMTHNQSIVEAENCLFKNNTQYCAEDGKDHNIVLPEWDQYTNITYSPSDNSEIKENALWKKNEAKYTKIQNFFHCTKHCMHKKLDACTNTKGCGIQMPTVDEFTSKMQTCIKKNVKINNSLLLACQCLAWKNGVKDLQGSCVTLGNSYFVDRA